MPSKSILSHAQDEIVRDLKEGGPAPWTESRE